MVVGSSIWATFFFLVARGAVGDPELCLPLSEMVREGDLDPPARLRGGDGAAGRWARLCLGGSGDSSDSGTSRSSIGWLLGPTPAAAALWASASSLDFGRPLAACAQERRVVRDARRAASFSSRTAGDIKLGPARWGRVCDRWVKEGRVRPL